LGRHPHLLQLHHILDIYGIFLRHIINKKPNGFVSSRMTTYVL
jgi:hypothetical protein